MSENAAGVVLGSLLSPLTGAISALRNRRMFHPSGVLCRARVESVAELPELRVVAERLQGPALMRLSSALWKEHTWPDVLGCALRFSEDVTRVEPLAGDQDLLLATIRRPWTLPFAPLSTRYQDFFANYYYAVSPFEVPPLGRVEWRLAPEPGASEDQPREELLRRRIAAGTANFLLECAPYRSPLSAFNEGPFRPVARISALEFSELDQEALRFDPFRAGRGLIPVGFVHGLRRATYAASQKARPKWQNAGAATGQDPVALGPGARGDLPRG
jgi:hypothetical protein